MTGIARYPGVACSRKGLAGRRDQRGRATELWLDKSPRPPIYKPLTWIVFLRAGRSRAVPVFPGLPMVSRIFSALALGFRRMENRDGE